MLVSKVQVGIMIFHKQGKKLEIGFYVRLVCSTHE